MRYGKSKSFVLVAALLSGVCSVHAGEYVVSGNLFGSVFQNHMDLDGDGLNGRSGTLRVRQSSFYYADVNVDSTIDFSNPQGSCAPGETEIIPSGQVAFSNYNGSSALFVEIDSSVHLCFGLVPEQIAVNVVGGRGVFESSTGSGVITLPDDVVLNADPATGAPRMVYVNDGNFVINVIK